jgi:hypothetical protein
MSSYLRDTTLEHKGQKHLGAGFVGRIPGGEMPQKKPFLLLELNKEAGEEKHQTRQRDKTIDGQGCAKKHEQNARINGMANEMIRATFDKLVSLFEFNIVAPIVRQDFA